MHACQCYRFVTCGSGRPYKHSCQPSARVGVAERAALHLHEVATCFAHRTSLAAAASSLVTASHSHSHRGPQAALGLGSRVACRTVRCGAPCESRNGTEGPGPLRPTCSKADIPGPPPPENSQTNPDHRPLV